ncbi:MAG TPA: hypothetical protein PK357_02635 [Candidatus Pacearchaeota archaeon]|nr:hypothetical protein [Candidatus Pacearchaeota archaeon]
MPKKSKTQVEIVNAMIKSAFGKGFSGNNIKLEIPKRNYLIKGCGLDVIVKKGFLYIPRLNEKYQIAGEFTSDDGSEIKVSAEYLNNAERYRKLYKTHFNKEVSIKIR